MSLLITFSVCLRNFIHDFNVRETYQLNLLFSLGTFPLSYEYKIPNLNKKVKINFMIF